VTSGYLQIGRIVAAQGIQGEVRVYPESDFPERFLEPGQRWIVRSGQTQPEAIELLKGRFLDGKGLYVVQFAGIDTRNQAEALRGATLWVTESDRPPLEEGEFHVSDLIGLPVYDQTTQTLIGTVRRVLVAGNDLLEVELSTSEAAAKPKLVLIPFVHEIVPVVDLFQNRIEITPPAGLIDL
jgi:16S rRNA processing protein RimM